MRAVERSLLTALVVIASVVVRSLMPEVDFNSIFDGIALPVS